MVRVYCSALAPHWQNNEVFYNIQNGEFSKKFEASIEHLKGRDEPDEPLIEILGIILHKHLGEKPTSRTSLSRS